MSNLRVLEWQNGEPHKGRVFAAIYPHSDDFTFQSVGLIAKLIHEGYSGYFIRTTDDCMDSYDLSYGEATARIEVETEELANLLGIRKVYHLNYKNHYLGYEHLAEIRHRLILLFRFLKVDTVITFDPFGHGEENPDHLITGMAVDHACWMSGRQLDLPESKDMGLLPQFVSDRYYAARGAQEANYLVDLEPALHLRAQAIRLHKTPLNNMWKVFKERTPDEDKKTIGYQDFVDTYFVNKTKDPCMGLIHYEKYYHVSSYLF